MVVYRYLTEEHGLQALQSRSWKIGRLLELNDPLDCRPLVRRGGVPMDIGSDRVFTEIYDSIGIICYSAAITDPVVWSHYAECHRGFALGFDLAPDNPDPDPDRLFPVHYPEGNERAALDYDVLETAKGIGQEVALLKIISHGFTRKAKSWAYEMEHRQFAALDGCRMVGRHYFRSLPIQNLKRVVLGVRCRTTVGDIKRITQKYWQHLPSMGSSEIARACLDKTSYELNIVPEFAGDPGNLHT